MSYELAPTPDAIDAMTVADLHTNIPDAEDREISIKTQLEFQVDPDFSLRERRISALIHWRQAHARMKRRLTFLRTERKPAS